MKRNRTLYTLLGIGVIGMFVGHAAWAVQAKDSFVKLITGTWDHLFGVTVAGHTAEAWVRSIGYVDFSVTAVIVAMVVGAYTQRGRLYDLAYSRFAIAILGWASFWGFLTAASRMTGAGNFFPEVWDLIERAPNVMLPLGLIYLIVEHRKDNTAARPATTIPIETAVH